MARGWALKGEPPPLAGAELTDQHLGGAFGIDLTAGNQHTALGAMACRRSYGGSVSASASSL